MKLLVINGPNINMLGIRQPEIYGKDTYADLCNMIENHCREKYVDVEVFQSNHEGAIIDKIQEAYGTAHGILINAGAYTHTSIAILDALKGVDIPTVEVHISDIYGREEFRKTSFISPVASKTICGKGLSGYLEGIDFLTEYLSR